MAMRWTFPSPSRPQRPKRRKRRPRTETSRSGPSARTSPSALHEGAGAVAKDAVYSEHWAGHRAVSVTVEPDAITIRRVEADGSNGENGD